MYNYQIISNMKKLYLLGALVLALTVAVFAKTTRTHVYEWPSGSINIGTDVDDRNWTCKNTGVSFTHNGSAFRIFNNGGADCDSWLVSPSFDVTAGNQYEVSFEYNGTSTTEFTWNLYFTAATPLTDADAVKALTPVEVPSTNTSDPYTAFKHTFTADANGKMYIAINNYGHFKGGVLMKNFTIDELVTEEDNNEPEGPHDCAGIAVPYHSSPALSSTEFAVGWDYLNNNNDEKHWEPANDYSTGNHPGAKLGYTSNNGLDQDDYLFSPAIHLARGTEYVVKYDFKTGSNSDKEDITVYLSESKEPEAVKASTVVKDYVKYGNTTMTSEVVYITPEKTGDYHVVFYVHSAKFQNSIAIVDLLVATNEFAPGGVANLVATPGANRALSCTLSWTLPTTDVFGSALTSEQTITAVKVYRDDEEAPIATLSGDATSFEDTATTSLTSGKHTYSVSVVVDGVEGAKTTVATGYVGPIEPSAIPALFEFTSEDDYEMWTPYKGPNASSYAYMGWSYDKSNKAAKFALSGTERADHYLISPPLNFEEAGYYRVTWELSTSSEDYTNVVLYLLDGLDVRNANVVDISGGWAVPYGYTTTIPRPNHIVDFRIETPGTYYIGTQMSVNQRSSANSWFYDMKVEESKFIPSTVTELTAEPDETGANKIKVTWVNPEKDFAGLDMNADQYKVEIYLNDAETPAKTITDNSTDVILEVEKAGLYTVTVKTVSTDGESSTAPVAPSVTTAWVGTHFVELPYSTEFKKDDETVAIWDIINVSQDAYTFYHHTSSNPNGMALKRYSGTSYNDYVLSPYMHLEPGYYNLSMRHVGGNASSSPYITWKPIIGLCKVGETEPTTAPTRVIELPSQDLSNGYNEVEYSAIFHVANEGDYQVCYGINQYFYTISYDSYMPKLCAFKMESTEAFPGDVTDLAAVVDKDVNTTVHISWTNPTTIKGTEIQIDEIKSVVIERDGELVATITEGLTPGEEASYDDEDVPAGLHEYTVFCAIDGKGYAPEGDGVPTHAEVYPTITTGWVGDGLSAPVNHHQNFPGWTTHDENSDADASEAGKYAWTMKNTYMFIYGYNKNHNDYLVSCPMNIEENVVYKVSYFTATPMDGLTNDIAVPVKIGKDADHKDFTTVSSIALTSTQDKYTYNWHTFYVMVDDKEAEESEEEEQPSPEAVKARAPEADATDEPTTFEDFAALAAKVPSAGAHRFALHFTEPGGMRVQSFKFEEAAKKQIQTGLDAVEAAGVAFDGDALCFAGEADVKVFNVAGACVANETAHDGFSFEGFAPGYYIVKVTVDGETTTLKVAVK